MYSRFQTSALDLWRLVEKWPGKALSELSAPFWGQNGARPEECSLAYWRASSLFGATSSGRMTCSNRLTAVASGTSCSTWCWLKFFQGSSCPSLAHFASFLAASFWSRTRSGAPPREGGLIGPRLDTSGNGRGQ